MPSESEYLVERIAQGKSRLIIQDDNDVIEKGIAFGLDRETFIRGYERYIKWCTDYERSIFTYAGDIDAEEADIIVQLGLFNEIIFG